MSVDKQVVVREAVFHAAVTALAQTVIFKDYERNLEALFRDERVSERAVAFTSTFGRQANVLGASPKTRLASWTSEEASIYTLRRTEPWEPAESMNDDERGDDLTSPRLMQGAEPPPELLDLRSHEQMETVSLIRKRLWDRAGWTGTAFLTDPANVYPPVFALVFRNREAGREIFVHWRKELGKVDVQEQIRLAIVRGIDKVCPHAYRVMIGSNPLAVLRGSRFVTFVNRIRRMDATTTDNLDRFLRAHAAVGAFYLAPAFAPPDFDGSQAPEVDMDIGIGVHHVHVRNAWEIGPHDMDAAAIHEDDDPVIPESVKDAPVLKLITTAMSANETVEKVQF
jgi:hypothetical protein